MKTVVTMEIHNPTMESSKNTNMARSGSPPTSEVKLHTHRLRM
jgi:hypothetical protein